MNVLLLIKNSEVGGVLSCSISLAKGLQSKGDNVVIGTASGEGVEFLANEFNNVEIIEFGSKNPIIIIRNYSQIKSIIEKNNIQIIHCQNRIPALYASYYCKFHKKVKYIWANHLVPLGGGMISKMMTHYGSAAVAESIDGKEMLVSTFNVPSDKVEVINLGTDIDKLTTVSEQKKAN